jgi:thiamine pyrophosphate-dependent acetolactate synthase large subunit-like protein
VTRADAVARVADALPPDCLTIACNGMIGRELYACADSPVRFYMIGAMGLASSIGLGLALVRPARTVVVFDGDGNVLMNMGALASVAAAGTPNLFHVVFDNAAHGSTGDQRTVSDLVPLEQVASAAGYRLACRVRDEASLNDALATFFTGPGPAMLLIEVAKGNKPGIGRVDLTPPELTARFRSAVRHDGECGMRNDE